MRCYSGAMVSRRIRDGTLLAALGKCCEAGREVTRMVGHYEVDGTLEGNQLIRLKEPLPCKEGPVKVIVTPQSEEAGGREPNRAALEALSSFLAEPDDLTPEQWVELEKLIEEHPLRIRKASAA